MRLSFLSAETCPQKADQNAHSMNRCSSMGKASDSRASRSVDGFASDPDNGGLVKTILGNDTAGDQCNLITALVMVDDLGHKTVPLVSWRPHVASLLFRYRQIRVRGPDRGQLRVDL
jgi:hypothetical protein